MKSNPDHGRKLTSREYELAVVALHEEDTTSDERKNFIRRRELDLNIDFRLGTDFPRERRELLWSVQQSIDKRMVALGISWLVDKLTPNILKTKVNRITSGCWIAYSEVLTDEELNMYFGQNEPVDGTH
jgi:hypothetical protein